MYVCVRLHTVYVYTHISITGVNPSRIRGHGSRAEPRRSIGPGFAAGTPSPRWNPSSPPDTRYRSQSPAQTYTVHCPVCTHSHAHTRTHTHTHIKITQGHLSLLCDDKVHVMNNNTA